MDENRTDTCRTGSSGPLWYDTTTLLLLLLPPPPLLFYRSFALPVSLYRSALLDYSYITARATLPLPPPAGYANLHST